MISLREVVGVVTAYAEIERYWRGKVPEEGDDMEVKVRLLEGQSEEHCAWRGKRITFMGDTNEV